MNKGNNIFDLCFHTGQDLSAVEWFIDLKQEFEKNGITVMAFTTNPELGIEWDKRSMHDYIVLPEYHGKINVPDAANFVNSLGFNNFRSLYQTPQFFYDLKENFCQQKMAGYVHALQGISSNFRAKVYLTFGGDEFDHNCLRILSRMHKGRTIYSHICNLPDRFVLFENEERYWKIPNRSIPQPNNEDLESIRNYIRNYIGSKNILWGDPKETDVKWKWAYPLKIIKRIPRSLKLKKSNPQSSNWVIVKDFLKRVVRRFISKGYYMNISTFVNGNVPFVYFPLHYPKDSQLTLRGKPFLNQASIVETVSRYLPYPYILLVKEHPHARGWYKISEIKRMSKLPNVRLIHPFTNSHIIIPKSKAIIAINSNVGYEGIMYKKPVITMGKSFYKGQGLTIDVDSLYDLENAFEQMETFILDDLEVLKFIWKMKSFSYPLKDYFNKDIKGIDREEYMINFVEGYIQFINNCS